MEAGVFVEFGVEGYAELVVLAGGDDAAIDFGQGLGIAVHLNDAGGADKRQRHFTVDSGYLSLGSKAAELPAVGITLDKYIHGCQSRRALIVMDGKVVGQQNQAGAGAQDGHAFDNAGTKLIKHAKLGKQLALNGGLAAGEDQTVKVLPQISRLPQFNTTCAQLGQPRLVLGKSALDRQHGDRLVCIIAHVRSFLLD